MRDNTLILKDAGLVAPDAAGTVGGSAAIGNVGPAAVKGEVIVNVTALEIASNDELYKIKLAGFQQGRLFKRHFEDLAILEIGAAEVLGGDQ